MRLIHEEAGQRLAAGPGEGPIRRRQVDSLQSGLGRLPDRRDLGGEMQPDLRGQRRCYESGLRSDKGAPFLWRRHRFTWANRHCISFAMTSPESRIQPMKRLLLNLARQSFGSSKSVAIACQARCTATPMTPSFAAHPRPAAVTQSISSTTVTPAKP